jgi:hypothetical protein
MNATRTRYTVVLAEIGGKKESITQISAASITSKPTEYLHLNLKLLNWILPGKHAGLIKSLSVWRRREANLDN